MSDTNYHGGLQAIHFSNNGATEATASRPLKLGYSVFSIGAYGPPEGRNILAVICGLRLTIGGLRNQREGKWYKGIRGIGILHPSY